MSSVYEGSGLSASMVTLARARTEFLDGFPRMGGVFSEGSDVVGSEGTPVPGCVPPSEVAAMTVCVRAVASGEYTGVGFAEVLQRAELRCETAGGINALGLPHADAAKIYAKAVKAVDESFGWRSDFVSEVADLAVVMGVASRPSGLPRLDELEPSVKSALSLRVVGDNVAVATPAAAEGAGDKGRLHDDHRVVPFSVYKALIGVSAKVVGAMVFVSVSRSVDGVYRLERTFDCSSCYPVSSLPYGRYSLPGGMGKLVSGSFLSGVLESVVAMPVLKATAGFCYVAVLPPSVRLKAASILGKEPSVMNLVSYFPEVYDWCSADAVVEKTGVSGENFVYHVVSGGVLPACLPRLARVGMAAHGEDRYASELSAHTDKLLEGIFGDAGTSQTLKPPLAAPRSRAASAVSGLGDQLAVRDRGQSTFQTPRVFPSPPTGVLAVPSREHRHVRSISDSGLTLSNRVVLDMGAATAFRPVWQDVDNPRARTWVTRLGEGAPIDPKYLLDLTKVKSSGDLPLPPASVSGVSVAVKPDNAMRAEGGKLVSWDRRSVVIPGCNVEYAKLSSSKGKKFVAVHPMRGVICRYDLSFERSVVVNGGLNVISTGCVLWMHSDASFHVVGSGTVVRTWFDDGMPGLGAMVTSMIFSFSATAVRVYGTEIHAERVIGLELQSVDVNAGLARFHKRFKMRPSVEKVHLYAFDEVVAEPVLLVVQARGLRYVVVHGTRIPADSCQVSVVVLDAQTTVKICVDATGEVTAVDAQMIFVRESHRYAMCMGHDISAKESNFVKKGLFIEGGS